MKWDRVANTDTAELCERVESMMLADTNLGGDKSGSEKESADPKTRAALQPDEVAEEIQRLNETKGVDSGSWMPFWLTLVPWYTGGFEEIEWKILQRIFLRNFKLPHEFDYTKYLRQKIYDALAHSLEVRPSTWCIIIAVTLGYSGIAYWWDWVTTEDFGSESGDDGSRRRQLGGGGGGGAGCWAELNTAVSAVTTASGAVSNATADAASSGRRQLGGGGGGGDELTPEMAEIQVYVMLWFGWILVFLNFAVVVSIKAGIHSLIKHQGCDRPNSASLFLRKLDAQLAVRLMIPKIALFKECDDDFAADASCLTDVKFCAEGAELSAEGDSGEMFFIVSGSVQLKTQGRGVLGTIEQGNVFGEMCLLFGESQTKQIVAAEPCVICSLDAGAFSELEGEHAHSIQMAKDAAERRKRMEPSATKRALEAQPEPSKKASQSFEMDSHGSGHGHGHGHGGTTLPGMGKEHGHGHGAGSRMPWADDILPPSRKSMLDTFGELMVLLNCFYMSFYLSRVMIVQ